MTKITSGLARSDKQIESKATIASPFATKWITLLILWVLIPSNKNLKNIRTFHLKRKMEWTILSNISCLDTWELKNKASSQSLNLYRPPITPLISLLTTAVIQKLKIQSFDLFKVGTRLLRSRYHGAGER